MYFPIIFLKIPDEFFSPDPIASKMTVLNPDTRITPFSFSLIGTELVRLHTFQNTRVGNL